MTVQKGGWDWFQEAGLDSSGDLVTDSAGDSAVNTNLGDALAGERNRGTVNAYQRAIPSWTYTVWAHGDGDTIVTSSPAVIKAIIETSALTGDVTLRDGTTATAQSIGTYSATTDLYGLEMDSGIFIDDNATAGEILIVWRLK